MKPGTLTHTIAVLLSSVAGFFTHAAQGAVPPSKVGLTKKSKAPKDDSLFKVEPIAYSPAASADPPLNKPAERFRENADRHHHILDCEKRPRQSRSECLKLVGQELDEITAGTIIPTKRSDAIMSR